jgi:CheY-like chemotaxis protein
LTAPTVVDGICQTLISSFDRAIGQLYHPDDLQRGFLSGLDRHGMLRRFGLLSISIGVVTTERRSFGSATELARVAAEMKHYAKTQLGSSFAVNGGSLRPPRSRLAATRRRDVVVVSDDASLRVVLHTALADGGYAVHEAVDLPTRPCDVADGAMLVVLLADARIGEPLWAFCRAQVVDPDGPAIIILTASATEEVQARAAGVATVLCQPLPINDVIDCVTLAAGSRGGGASKP